MDTKTLAVVDPSGDTAIMWAIRQFRVGRLLKCIGMAAFLLSTPLLADEYIKVNVALSAPDSWGKGIRNRLEMKLNAIPDVQVVPDSADARRWSDHLGLPFYEAAIETNGHNISLVFSDLIVQAVDPGYAPFVVPAAGPDFKIPIP